MNGSKLIKIIKTKQDANDLQSDSNLLSWCNQNHLNLNISKRKFMYSNLIKNPIHFHYSVCDF